MRIATLSYHAEIVLGTLYAYICHSFLNSLKLVLNLP